MTMMGSYSMKIKTVSPPKQVREALEDQENKKIMEGVWFGRHKKLRW